MAKKFDISKVVFRPEDVRNPKRVAKDVIECEYLHPHLKEWVQFAATPFDEYGHGREAYSYFSGKGI